MFVYLCPSLPAPDDGPKGNCSCGGFATSSIEPGSQPLLSQTPGLVVKCDDEGAGTCKSLCNALATATKAKGPEVLCNRLKNAKELKVPRHSIFYGVSAVRLAHKKPHLPHTVHRSITAHC